MACMKKQFIQIGREEIKVKRRLKRGLAFLLTLCLLGGNLAFAEELPGTGEEPVIKEETVAENEEAPVENAENAGVQAEDELETSEENVPEPVRGAADTIYLNGQSGDDTKDGSTPENAVKTFGQAKTLATNNQGITKIVVIGTTEIEGDITLEGTKAKILRGENFNDYVFKVPEGKAATLKNITIDGNSDKNHEIEQSLIYVTENAKLAIQDGAVIRNNRIKEITDTATRGGGIHAQKATLSMTGGVIEENQGTYGGGIYLFGSTMNFTGGVIRKNLARRVEDKGYNQIYSAGGGICMYQGSTVLMSDNAEVRNNIADEIGGGISVGTNQISGADFKTIDLLEMKGGIIDGNEAGAAGGGIFIQGCINQLQDYRAEIYGGRITSNKMNGSGKTQKAFGGGGIYVNGVADPWEFQGHTYHGRNGELILKNAIITENTAEMYGAGIAACPISKTVIKIGNGAAIYRNNALLGAKDIFILSSQRMPYHSGHPKYELPHHMLGGIPYLWKLEDGTLLPDDQYARTITENEAALMLHTDSVGSDFTKALAKVWITGNYSTTAGAGIGSNGSISIGDDTPSTDIQVVKKWNDAGKENTRPEKVVIKLMARIGNDPTEYVVATRELNEANNWKTIFKNLPTMNGDQPITYSVKEEPVAGYQTRITGSAKDGFTITNKPDTPPPTPSEEKIDIPVEKIWKDNGYEDKRPTEITVTLYADGVRTNETLVLNASNDWKGVFRSLPEKKDGNVITYTMKEVEVKGYESVLTGNQSDGFVLTNTYKPEKPPAPPTPPTPPIPSIPFVRIPRAGA